MKRVIGKSQLTVEAILERKYMLIICEIMGKYVSKLWESGHLP